MSVVPLPFPGNNDRTRPGQQLLPPGVIALLKSLKILFGTDKSGTGVDYDPTMALMTHIIECMGALKNINKVYKAKGSIASRTVGSRFLCGFSAELTQILLDACSFSPPENLASGAEAMSSYCVMANAILNIFPEMAEIEPNSAGNLEDRQITDGKLLLHHCVSHASSGMLMNMSKMLVKSFPRATSFADVHGALPLHLAMHNPNCTSELIELLVKTYPSGISVKDDHGFIPLHWAVNKDNDRAADIVSTLLGVYPAGASVTCTGGTLPLHWAVDSTRPSLQVCRSLLKCFPDGCRTFCDNGWLPIHRCVNRTHIDGSVLDLLLETYPLSSQCALPASGQLPLHIAVSHPSPSIIATQLLLRAFANSAQTYDDDGYLPLHCALDNRSQSMEVTQELVDVYPEGVFQKTKNGWLPLHVALCSESVSVDIIRYLVSLHPNSALEAVVEYFPTTDGEGGWVERRWTPMSKALERGLESVAAVIRVSISKTPAVPLAHQNPLVNITQLGPGVHSQAINLPDSDDLYNSEDKKNRTDDTSHPMQRQHDPVEKKHSSNSRYNNHKAYIIKKGGKSMKEKLEIEDGQISPPSSSPRLGSVLSRGKSAPSHRPYLPPPKDQPPMEMKLASQEVASRPGSASQPRPSSAHPLPPQLTSEIEPSLDDHSRYEDQ